MDLCFSQDITALLPDNKRLDANYLVHFLRTQESYFARMARGATIKGITREVIEQLSLPLPSLDEQRRIAAILDTADSLRTKRRRSTIELDSLTQAAFLETFGDPRFNRKRWPIRKLREIGDLERGVSKHRPRNAPELLGGPYPFVQTGDVAKSGPYLRRYTGTYSERGLQQSRLWPKGTLCITIAANIAKTAILTFEACFPDSIVGFRPHDATTAEFVQTWLSFMQTTLESTAPESAQKNINLEILRNLPVPTPPKYLQDKFTRIVRHIEGMRGAYVTARARLEALLASLQYRAFAGEL